MPFPGQRKHPYTIDTTPKRPAPPDMPGAPAAPALVIPRLALTPIVLLFDSLAIVDTVSHRPLALLDLRRAKQWFFEIDNGLDQALTVTSVGAMLNDPAGAPTMEVAGSVAANSREAIVNDLFAPWVGVTLQASTAPTTGVVTVRGQVQVEE